MFGHLNGEIVLVAGLVGTVLARVVDPHDIVNTAPVARHADYGGGVERRRTSASENNPERTALARL
jgi:hypothetical protein